MRNLLDPSVEYSFLPYASNINGCTPDYTDPHTGATFWFGTSFTATLRR